MASVSKNLCEEDPSSLLRKHRIRLSSAAPDLVGACLATGDRISATGSDTVSKCVL